MASDDVIELGSSDEETEPAPKKKKPPLNAMVHIPNKIPGLTIKSSKSNTKLNPAIIAKGSIGKSVTVTKVTKSNINPFANIKVLDRKQAKGLLPVKAPPPPVKHNVRIPVQKSAVLPNIINPKVLNYSMLKTGIIPNKSGLKTYPRGNPINPPGVNTQNLVRILKPDTCLSLKTNTITKSPNHKNILPPGITIKRAAPTNFKSNTNQKRVKLTPNVLRMSKTGMITSTNNSEVLTVDLDDDEPATSSTSGPQWYLRPEDQNNGVKSEQNTLEMSPENETEEMLATDEEKQPKKSLQNSQKQSSEEASQMSAAINEPSELEQQNNKEPDKTKYIEITIEDSPIKPAHNKKGFKVGAELAITIEDSPVKITAELQDSSCNSDNEKDVSPKDYNSKKKLEYPKTVAMVETVEIEFEPLPKEKSLSNSEKNSVPLDTEDKSEKSKHVSECMDIVEVEESTVKPADIEQITTPKKRTPSKPECDMTPIETVVLDGTDKDEFNSIYQSFINLCFQLENSEDMKKIVEKKIKAYYRQVPKEYTDSEAFTDMVSSKIMAMKASPEKMYLYIKDIVDELNMQRKIVKAQPSVKDIIIEEQENFLYGEDSEFDAKRQRQIRKLEKTLKKLHRAIQKLEEQEVDFDDEEDSVYLLTDSVDDTSAKDDQTLNKEVLLKRYKERMVRVHAKLCQLTNTKMPSEAKVLIEARPGRPKGPVKRLEKWINRKVPIGTPLPFPDFHDVVRCVREANNEDKLGWNEADIMEEARDLFTRCGKKLQRRRQENEWRLAASRIPTDEADPAEDSAELKRKLEENKKLAAKKETELFNKYADRQNQLNLEAVEIGDKEAEESPVESDDEEPVEETDPLSNKEKRKERLKRLLQEKSKKIRNDQENQLDDHIETSEISINEASKNSNETKSSMKGSSDKLDNPENENPGPALLDKKPLNTDLPDKSNKDSGESDSSANNSNKSKYLSDKVHSLSDDSNKIDSDMNELNLLQKLDSGNEFSNNSVRDSDSSSAIAISDTSSINGKTSSDDQHTEKRSCDVISIENSSYSESEETKGSMKDVESASCISTKKVIEESVDATIELECSNDGVEKKTNRTNNEEYNGCLEDILLASSDNESEDTELLQKNLYIDQDDETSVNLKDDNISIGETVIEERRTIDDGSGENSMEVSDKNGNIDTSSLECVEIGSVEIQHEHQNDVEESIIETASIHSTEEGITEITTLKSLEAGQECNVKSTEEGNHITCVNFIETGDDKVTTEIEHFKSIVNENISETSVKPIRNIGTKNDNETCDVPVENIGDENNTDKCIKPIEDIVDDDNKETDVSNTPVQNSDSTNSNEKCVKSFENTVDDDVNKTSVAKIPVENIGSENVLETCIESIENQVVEGVNKTDFETIKDDLMIHYPEVSSNNEKNVAMDTAMVNNDNTNDIDTTKKTDSISEAMEVDSNVEQTL